MGKVKAQKKKKRQEPEKRAEEEPKKIYPHGPDYH